MRIGYALMVGCFHATAVGQGSESSHRYYYFKEPRPLQLDTTAVATFDKATSSVEGQSASSSSAGRDRLNLPGWSFREVEATARHAAGIRMSVSSLANSGRHDFVSPVFLGTDGGPVLITRQILCQFRPGVSKEQVEGVLAALSAGTILETDYANLPGCYRVLGASRDGFEVLAAANRLALRDDVLFAEPDVAFTGRGSLIPNDPFFGDVWGVHNTGQLGGLVDFDMDGPEAWDLTLGDPSIIVVILDVGVEQTHPDINQIPGTDTTGAGGTGGPANACDNHGTPVAGCVSATANNGLGTVGIAPGCRIASARTFVANLTCNGTWSSNASWTVDSLTWAEANGARVTNNSNYYGFTSGAIATKYQSTKDNGMVHFASAGNDSSSSITYPASLTSVNAVAAMNRFGQRASFSNYGAGLDFSAPGEDIHTTDRTGSAGWVFGDYVFANGTSFASPYSAGVAALVLSTEPTLDAYEVEALMQVTTTDLNPRGYDTDTGWGVVNAYNAVAVHSCIPLSAAVDEVGPVVKNRYLSFRPGNSGRQSAIRVRMVELMNPLPENLVCCPPDLSSFEGQDRWVGPASTCPDSPSWGTTFKCAKLQCEPHYENWSVLLGSSALHVTGSEVVPSSTFEVQVVDGNCDAQIESNFAAPLVLTTARWGDVTEPFQDPGAALPSQPDVLDVSKMVDTLKETSTRLTKPRAQIFGNDIDPMAALTILDVSGTIDAVVGDPYSFSALQMCP